MKSDIVIGLQFGDEGKGKVVDHLIKNGKYSCCVRYNGGPNAGHTVYYNNQKLVTHQVPTGAIHGIRSLIGSSCMIDPKKLGEELDMIENAGVKNIRNIVKVAYNCHIITPTHIETDKLTDTVGSTGCGMGPAYADKYMRNGFRAENYKNGSANGTICGCEIVNPIDFFKKDDAILFEGAQGYMLDINWGDYPYVTSTHCDTGFIVSTGVSPRTIRDVYGIVKLYTTYVGKMKYQPNDQIFNKLASLGHEYGATTGRKRQCNWMNLNEVIRAIEVNGVNMLIVNKCDIIKQLGVFKLYHNNEIVEFENIEDMTKYITANVPLKTIIFSESPTTI